MKDFRSSFSDASVPGSAWYRTGEEAPPHGQQAEPAVHEVPRQSLGTRIVHGVAVPGIILFLSESKSKKHAHFRLVHSETLGKDDAVQNRVLCERFVKRNQLIARSLSERGEKRVVPDLWRERLHLGVTTPERLKVRRFFDKGNVRIAQDGVVHAPSLAQRYGIITE